MKLLIFLSQLFFLCKQSVQKKVTIDEKAALLIIDVQNCFLKGGSLAVDGGNEIIPIINELREEFETVILTQDWHCENHISFASAHPGEKVFNTIKLEYDQDGNLCNDEANVIQMKSGTVLTKHSGQIIV